MKRAAEGHPRMVAVSIIVAGEAANIAKTYAYTYQMCPYLYVLFMYLLTPAWWIDIVNRTLSFEGVCVTAVILAPGACGRGLRPAVHDT